MHTIAWLWYTRTWMEPDTIHALVAALRDQNVDYVLVGALAMDVLGIGRFTEDIDLFVRPTPDKADAQALKDKFGRKD